MNHLCLILTISLTVAVSPVSGQTAAQPGKLPSGPLIAEHAPDFSQWVETTEFKNDDASGRSNAAPTPPSKSTPLQIVKVIKTGPVRHVTFITGTEVTSETWCKGSIQLVMRPYWSEPLLSTGVNRFDAARLDFSHGDFTGFDWIDADSFTGMRQVGGRPCMVFQSNVAVDPSSPATKVETEAIVDLETRLPVSLQKGKTTSTYVFGSPPNEILTLPPNLEAFLDKWYRKVQALAGTPTRP